MKALIIAGGVLASVLAVAILIVWSGAVDVAADNPHSAAVFNLLETARERSIATRIRGIEAPDLSDPAMIRRGAGNYDSMCATCHLAPDVEDTELSLGLYPAPPNLARHEPADPARAFWIIKHGVKATGMPAWGKSMEDHYIWDMVAFVRQLPSMTAEQYAAQVEASGGHSHGGGETGGADETQAQEHSHADAGESEHAHEDSESPTASGASEPDPQAAQKKSTKSVHTHDDGKEHVHE
jgi:mono/diheme cytochrome c family protein